MRDFVDRLDLGLQVIATDVQSHPSRLRLVPPLSDVGHQSPRRRAGRRLLVSPLLAGATATLAVFIASMASFTGSDAGGLPILDTEISDASAASSERLASTGVDFRRAHAFGTPFGPGWVLVTEGGKTLCITMPDQVTPGEYGSACGPTARVERDGMALESVGDRGRNPTAKNLVGWVLPLGARDVRLQSGGTTTRLRVESGVAVAALNSQSTFRFERDGQEQSRTFEGPFEGGHYLCNGKIDPTPDDARLHQGETCH